MDTTHAQTAVLCIIHIILYYVLSGIMYYDTLSPPDHGRRALTWESNHGGPGVISAGADVGRAGDAPGAPHLGRAAAE